MSLSIVTIHLQDFINLEHTFRSIQSIKWISTPQWIVIDGGSRPETDAEARVLEGVTQFADHFVSAPDQGIYDAMNKGTRLADSQYLLYLNSGDIFHPDFNSARLDEVINKDCYGMIWAQCIERYENGALVRVKTRSEKWAWYGMPACHQAMLFQRTLLGDQPFDQEFHIAADYDLVCRLLSEGAIVQRLKMPLCIFTRGGTSDNNPALLQHEFRIIQKRYFSIPRPLDTAIWAFKIVNSKVAKLAWFRRLWRKWI